MHSLIKILMLTSISLALVYSQETNSTVQLNKKTKNEKVLAVLQKKTDDNATNIHNKDLVPVIRGDHPTTNMQVDFDAYASVILIDTQGKRSLLLPSKETPDTYVEKGKPITMLNEETLKSVLPLGLHYLLIVVSQERLILGVTTKKGKQISALKNDADFTKVLEDIKTGQYGKFIMKMVPLYK